MIVFLSIKGKQNVEGGKVFILYPTYLKANTYIYIFFHPNSWFLFIQLYPFFDRNIKNSLNLDVIR